MSTWLRNRRTGYAFRTKRTLRQGKYIDEILWLKDHGYVYFDQHSTPDGYIWETWIDNYGNVIHFKIERISGTPMAEATIVESRYIPAEGR